MLSFKYDEATGYLMVFNFVSIGLLKDLLDKTTDRLIFCMDPNDTKKRIISYDDNFYIYNPGFGWGPQCSRRETYHCPLCVGFITKELDKLRILLYNMGGEIGLTIPRNGVDDSAGITFRDSIANLEQTNLVIHTGVIYLPTTIIEDLK